jgi:hypothetical protein
MICGDLERPEVGYQVTKSLPALIFDVIVRIDLFA